MYTPEEILQLILSNGPNQLPERLEGLTEEEVL